MNNNQLRRSYFGQQTHSCYLVPKLCEGIMPIKTFPQEITWNITSYFTWTINDYIESGSHWPIQPSDPSIDNNLFGIVENFFIRSCAQVHF